MPGGESRLVLIVEDDSSMSQALERILRLGGHETVSYPSAEALLASGDCSAAACMILDIQLPGLTGLELHARLSQLGSVPPVIFITAFDEPEARAQAERLGASAFLAKPFSGRTLLATVRATLTALEAQPNGTPDRTKA